MRRWIGPIAAVALLCTPAGAGGAERRHDVSMFWEGFRVEQGGLNEFRSSGEPFGRAKVITAPGNEEPEEDVLQRVFLLKDRERGRLVGKATGSFVVRRDVVKTTSTYSVVKYSEGAGRFSRAGRFTDRDSGRYEGAKGEITKIRGRAKCFFASGRCDGGIRLKGWVKY